MCTTLWHETENEIGTLIRSFIRMITYANNKDVLEYEFEINIFFDDCFDLRNSAQHHAPDDHLQRWKVLNPYVNSFLETFHTILTQAWFLCFILGR